MGVLVSQKKSISCYCLRRKREKKKLKLINFGRNNSQSTRTTTISINCFLIASFWATLNDDQMLLFDVECDDDDRVKLAINMDELA